MKEIGFHSVKSFFEPVPLPIETIQDNFAFDTQMPEAKTIIDGLSAEKLEELKKAYAEVHTEKIKAYPGVEAHIIIATK